MGIKAVQNMFYLGLTHLIKHNEALFVLEVESGGGPGFTLSACWCLLLSPVNLLTRDVPKKFYLVLNRTSVSSWGLSGLFSSDDCLLTLDNVCQLHPHPHLVVLVRRVLPELYYVKNMIENDKKV